MDNLMFGADPEVFAAYNLDGKNYVLSPALMEKDLGLVQIDGDIKHPAYIIEKEYSWMMDGVAWELTLLRPHESLVNVWKVIRQSLDHLGSFLSGFKHPEFGELSLYTKPVINIQPEKYLPYLKDQKIYQGFIFGCDPDEDADDLSYHCQTIDVATHNYRYGGGHIHISGLEEFKNLPRPIVRLLACTVGNFVTSKSSNPELERMRVQTYGRPCRFRHHDGISQPLYGNKFPGVEYRTPSNSWISFSQDDVEELDFWARKAAWFLQNPTIGMDMLNNFKEDSYKAIINCDQKLSASILENIR